MADCNQLSDLQQNHSYARKVTSNPSSGTIQVLHLQNNLVVGVRKITIFADVQYYLCWLRASGWVRKSPKMCWRNIGMVPYQKACTFSDFSFDCLVILFNLYNLNNLLAKSSNSYLKKEFYFLVIWQIYLPTNHPTYQLTYLLITKSSCLFFEWNGILIRILKIFAASHLTLIYHKTAIFNRIHTYIKQLCSQN